MVDQNDEPNDNLEKSLVMFFNTYGINLYPVSNFLSDPGDYLQGIKYDGLILSGGGDVNPKFIDNESSHQINFSPEREKIENYLLKTALTEKVPILGICRGMQQLNCFFGGRMTAGIHMAEKTSRKPRLNHSIHIEKNIFGLDGIYYINHYHDHGIRRDQVPSSFDIFAMDSEYDVVEGIIHKDLPILGINWHPERKSPDIELNKIIIHGFLTFLTRRTSLEQ